MNARRKWQGVLTILHFNWPFYLAAVSVIIGSLTGVFLFNEPSFRLLSSLALAGAGYFLLGSLAVSHLIYDRSDLYRWKWLQRAVPACRDPDLLFCHCGFDEASMALAKQLTPASLTVLDHFDPKSMTEASIRRARAVCPPTAETLTAPFDHWPAKNESADIVFGILAIHELRSEEQRTEWFAEARRTLKSDGSIVLVEHLRDLPNFIAFGPRFLHFHSAASWRRCWEGAGLTLLDQFSVTPWIRIFIVARHD